MSIILNPAHSTYGGAIMAGSSATSLGVSLKNSGASRKVYHHVSYKCSPSGGYNTPGTTDVVQVGSTSYYRLRPNTGTSVIDNPAGLYSTSTGIITVTQPGDYLLLCHHGYINASAKYIMMSAWLNGSMIVQNSSYEAASQDQSTMISNIRTLAANDQVYFAYYYPSSSYGGPSTVYASVTLLG